MNPGTRIASIAAAMASTIVLGGCAAALSGIGGTEGYACKAPIGAQCTSISGVYANAGANDKANANANSSADLLASRAMHEALRPQGLLGMLSIPFVALKTLPAATDATTTDPVSDALVGTTASLRNAALRSPARVLRLWIAPWEDADGDLHEASFLHVVIDTGRWLVERVRPAPRSRMDIATPPLGSVAPTAVPQTSPTADLAPTEP
jgi:conjugal transfer pilus assembly protein TraV